MSASDLLATFSNPARFSTAHQLFRLFPLTGLMLMSVSDSTIISRRLLDAWTRHTRKRKRFLRLAGQRCPTILCEFSILFMIFTFSGKFRATALLDWKMERCCCSAEGIGEVTVSKVGHSKLESGN